MLSRRRRHNTSSLDEILLQLKGLDKNKIDITTQWSIKLIEEIKH